MDASHVAYIGFGSNLGDRQGNCRFGLEAIDQSETCTLKAVSRLYLTEPVGFEKQDWFLNGTARIETFLSARELFGHLKSIECLTGRRKHDIRFGPRTLDLDILFYDNLVLHAKDLTLPHPRLQRRRFVLRPLCDIEPELVHPVLKKSVRRLLEELTDDKKRVILYR